MTDGMKYYYVKYRWRKRTEWNHDSCLVRGSPIDVLIQWYGEGYEEEIMIDFVIEMTEEQFKFLCNHIDIFGDEK